MKKILQINFKFKVTRPQVEQVSLQAAPPFARDGDCAEQHYLQFVA